MTSTRRSALAIIVAALMAPLAILLKSIGFREAKASPTVDEQAKTTEQVKVNGEKKELTDEDKEILAKLQNGMKRIDTEIRKALADLELTDKIVISDITYITVAEMTKSYAKAGKKFDPKAEYDCNCKCCTSGSYKCCYNIPCDPCA